MKKIKTLLVSVLFLLGCTAVTVPSEFTYSEIQTRDFTLASWQKISNPSGVYKIYIEGDGYAFNAYGYPSQNPTPHSRLMREIAFGDKSENVVYLARPCQYVKSPICTQRHWTTARFATEVVNSEFAAVQQIAGNHPVILIGFSGGAQVAGLISTAKQGLNVAKIITIGGNLDHLKWTEYHHLPPLNESLNLENYRLQFLQIPQHHYAGENDEIIPPRLVEEFVENPQQLTIVPNAAHNSGWERIYPQIWQLSN